MTSKLPVSYRQAGAELRPASEVFPTSKTEVVSRGKEALSAQRSAMDEAKLRERMTSRMKEELDSFEPSLRNAIFTYYEGGLTNLQLAMKFLEYHPVLQDMFAYDTYADSMVRKKDIPDLDLPVGTEIPFCNAVPVTYTNQINLISWLELYGVRVKKEPFMAQLEEFARKKSFNPIEVRLGKYRDAWDGEPRLDTFFSRVFHKEDTSYYQELGKRFMIGAIGRALADNNKPYKFDWMPVLSGGQGLRKSTFCLALFGAKYLKEGLPPDLGNKDAKQELRQKWCVEISELTSFKKSTNDAIKSFLSSLQDTYRPTYGKDVQTFPRRCVFIGTTNGEEFLTDTTGNRRFMPIFLEKPIDIEWLLKNRKQLWGEAYTRYQEDPKQPTYISDELLKEAENLQERARVKDLLEDKVLKYFADPRGYPPHRPSPLNYHDGAGFSLSDLAEKLSLPDNRSTTNRLSAILKRNGYDRYSPRIDGQRLRLWRKKEGNPQKE